MKKSLVGLVSVGLAGLLATGAGCVGGGNPPKDRLWNLDLPQADGVIAETIETDGVMPDVVITPETIVSETIDDVGKEVLADTPIVPDVIVDVPDVTDVIDVPPACFTDPDCDDQNLCSKDRCLGGTCNYQAVSCDDGDVCTEDLCEAAIGCIHKEIPGCTKPKCETANDCADQDLCTEESCVDGQCYYLQATCDDQDPCTDDTCDSAQGCLHYLVPGCSSKCESDAQCDDGLTCTIDTCDRAAATCVHYGIDCDDDDKCTIDQCVEGVGCTHSPDPQCSVCQTNEECDDGNACTTDTCSDAFVCEHSLVSCDDLDICTKDYCDPLADGDMCVHEPIIGCLPPQCTSDEECPGASACTIGFCDRTQSPYICVITAQQDGTVCDDMNLCTVDDSCQAGSCSGGKLVACDDSNPCTEDQCDPSQGCVYIVVDPTCGGCQDDDECATGNPCEKGLCNNGACVIEKVMCDDASACTYDLCDPAVGGCVFTAIDCDDANVCTVDGCDLDLGCVHKDLPCEDGNACTVESCDPNLGCVYTDLVCDDANVCTKDFCDPDKGCVTETIAGCCGSDAECDDGNPCTPDSCSADRVCVSGPATCDDGDFCTVDSCDPTTGCLHSAVTCDDNDPCTIDSCKSGDSGPVCIHDSAEGGTCDDGNFCTVADTCTAGKCAGVPNTCDDGDLCTRDKCDTVAQKCVYAPVSCDDKNPCTKDECKSGPTIPYCVYTAANDVPCDDANPCTLDDVCMNKKCAGKPNSCDDGDACTADSCDPATGNCLHTPKVCDDLNPCTKDYCEAGVCMTAPLDGGECDDKNACTVKDTCMAGKCVGAAMDCNDGDGCTIDKCVSGACVHSPVSCNDKNECTNDICKVNPSGTPYCVYTAADGIPCNDGSLCTEGDTCAAKKCVGKPVDCDDKNLCTADSCDPLVGCLNVARDCSDKNPCTQDLCEPLTGNCYFLPAEPNTACDDGNICTVKDTCVGMSCVGTAPADCNDGVKCTKDVCDSATGCVHVIDPNCTCKAKQDCNDGNASTCDCCCDIMSSTPVCYNVNIPGGFCNCNMLGCN